MIISLDYDNTYTSDPKLWNKFILQAKQNSHTIYLVTYRYEEECQEVHMFLDDIIGSNNIIATGRKSNRSFFEKLGIHINVWIDDHPETISNNIEDL